MSSKSIENEVGLNKRTKKERKMNFLKNTRCVQKVSRMKLDLTREQRKKER